MKRSLYIGIALALLAAALWLVWYSLISSQEPQTLELGSNTPNTTQFDALRSDADQDDGVPKALPLLPIAPSLQPAVPRLSNEQITAELLHLRSHPLISNEFESALDPRECLVGIEWVIVDDLKMPWPGMSEQADASTSLITNTRFESSQELWEESSESIWPEHDAMLRLQPQAGEEAWQPLNAERLQWSQPTISYFKLALPSPEEGESWSASEEPLSVEIGLDVDFPLAYFELTHRYPLPVASLKPGQYQHWRFEFATSELLAAAGCLTSVDVRARSGEPIEHPLLELDLESYSAEPYDAPTPPPPAKREALREDCTLQQGGVSITLYHIEERALQFWPGRGLCRLLRRDGYAQRVLLKIRSGDPVWLSASDVRSSHDNWRIVRRWQVPTIDLAEVHLGEVRLDRGGFIEVSAKLAFLSPADESDFHDLQAAYRLREPEDADEALTYKLSCADERRDGLLGTTYRFWAPDNWVELNAEYTESWIARPDQLRFQFRREKRIEYLSEDTTRVELVFEQVWYCKLEVSTPSGIPDEVEIMWRAGGQAFTEAELLNAPDEAWENSLYTPAVLPGTWAFGVFEYSPSFDWKQPLRGQPIQIALWAGDYRPVQQTIRYGETLSLRFELSRIWSEKLELAAQARAERERAKRAAQEAEPPESQGPEERAEFKQRDIVFVVEVPEWPGDESFRPRVQLEVECEGRTLEESVTYPRRAEPVEFDRFHHRFIEGNPTAFTARLTMQKPRRWMIESEVLSEVSGSFSPEGEERSEQRVHIILPAITGLLNPRPIEEVDLRMICQGKEIGGASIPLIIERKGDPGDRYQRSADLRISSSDSLDIEMDQFVTLVDEGTLYCFSAPVIEPAPSDSRQMDKAISSVELPERIRLNLGSLQGLQGDISVGAKRDDGLSTYLFEAGSFSEHVSLWMPRGPCELTVHASVLGYGDLLWHAQVEVDAGSVQQFELPPLEALSSIVFQAAKGREADSGHQWTWNLLPVGRSRIEDTERLPVLSGERKRVALPAGSSWVALAESNVRLLSGHYVQPIPFTVPESGELVIELPAVVVQEDLPKGGDFDATHKQASITLPQAVLEELARFGSGPSFSVEWVRASEYLMTTGASPATERWTPYPRSMAGGWNTGPACMLSRSAIDLYGFSEGEAITVRIVILAAGDGSQMWGRRWEFFSDEIDVPNPRPDEEAPASEYSVILTLTPSVSTPQVLSPSWSVQAKE